MPAKNIKLLILKDKKLLARYLNVGWQGSCPACQGRGEPESGKQARPGIPGKEMQMFKKTLMALALVGAAGAVQAATYVACDDPASSFTITVDCGT
ncbi:MAG: hypothetical protein ACKPE6_12120, partial [Gammaproteobacteria bacterium]